MSTFRILADNLRGPLWPVVAVLGLFLLGTARSRTTPRGRAEARVAGVACLLLASESLFELVRYWTRILPGFDFW